MDLPTTTAILLALVALTLAWVAWEIRSVNETIGPLARSSIAQTIARL